MNMYYRLVIIFSTGQLAAYTIYSSAWFIFNYLYYLYINVI